MRASVASLVCCVVFGTAVARGDELIDLTAFDEIMAEAARSASVFDGVPIQPVAAANGGGRRFYLTGMLGETFATLRELYYADDFDGAGINRSVITAGGAAGVAFERANGRLRLEVEGRGRDDVTTGFPDGPYWSARDGWSALVNLWRDYAVTDRTDVYLGGGIGGGGYRYDFAIIAGPGFASTADTPVAAFAWQVGGGVIWNLTDRVAFDVGYRFFSIDQTQVTYTFTSPTEFVSLPQQFTASELLFGLRIYEPFRRWR